MSRKYFWPTAHGHPDHYGRAVLPAPTNLTKATWSWGHPEAEWRDMPMGASIDDKNNVYVAADQGLYKLDPNGKLIWKFNPPRADRAFMNNLGPDGVSLYEGAALYDTTDGRVFSLDMETGRVIWERKVAQNICFDTGYISVWHGVAIVETDASDHPP